MRDKKRIYKKCEYTLYNNIFNDVTMFYIKLNDVS